MDYNKQINPKEESNGFAAQLMPCRAKQIKKVVTRGHNGSAVGGATVLSTGTVFVPTADNAYDRTIRYHEALHAAHTDRKRVLKDMLDQALEDGRLHRYCSKAASSEFQRARRDEVTVALRDLRKAKRQDRVNPSTSLVAFRALAILAAGKIPARYQRLLDSVLARFGDDAKRNFEKALKLLADVNNWDAARKPLKQYFKNRFEKDTPAPEFKAPQGPKNQDPEAKKEFAPPPSLVDDEDEDEKEEQPEESEEESKEAAEGKEDEEDSEESEDDSKTSSKDSDDEDKDEEEQESGDSNDESEEQESDQEDEDFEGEGSESDSDSDDDIEDAETESDSDSDADDSDIKPMTPPQTSKPRKSNDPDLYTADLTPQIDKENFEKMSNLKPMKLFIRRLDMGINRVKLSMGRRAPLPVTSGRKILARRLAGAMSNPSSHVFARSVSQGGFGTILIDASGSMSIPSQVLIDFLAKAPALTLAFYNAPDDKVMHGNIFIYAANGYRASVANIGKKGSYYNRAFRGYEESGIEHYGIGNVIDYHAMAWLIKQPAPHYIVTDRQWTGGWAFASANLCAKLIESQQMIVVPNLIEMGNILEEVDRKRKQNRGGR